MSIFDEIAEGSWWAGNDASPRLHTTIDSPGYLTPLLTQAKIATDDQRQMLIEENSPITDETKT